METNAAATTNIQRTELEGNLEDRLKLIFNNIQAGVVIIHAELKRIVAANQAALDLIGAPKEAVVGQECTKYFCPVDQTACLFGLHEKLPDKQETILKNARGEEVPIIRKAVTATMAGNAYVVETFISIAEQKQYERMLYEQRMLAEALRDTATALNQSLNLHEVLERILFYIGRVVPNDAANVMLLEDGTAYMAACRGYEKLGNVERVRSQRRLVSEVPNLKSMIDRGEPLVVPDTRSSPDWVDFDTSSWIRSYASAPIRHKGKTIGFLNLNSSQPGFYALDHAQRLQAFADQAAIAIENAQLYEAAQREISVRKRAEAALHEAMNVLEVRVAERTAELEKTNEQLRIELKRRKEAEAALQEERSLLSLRVEERTAELSAANAELAKASRLKEFIFGQHEP